jgi:hypothetical protein
MKTLPCGLMMRGIRGLPKSKGRPRTAAPTMFLTMSLTVSRGNRRCNLGRIRLGMLPQSYRSRRL